MSGWLCQALWSKDRHKPSWRHQIWTSCSNGNHFGKQIWPNLMRCLMKNFFFFKKATTIAADYKWTLYNVEKTCENYDEVLSKVNLRHLLIIYKDELSFNSRNNKKDSSEVCREVKVGFLQKWRSVHKSWPAHWRSWLSLARRVRQDHETAAQQCAWVKCKRIV